MIKDIVEHPDGREKKGKSIWGRVGAFMPSPGQPLPQHFVWSPTRKLSKPCPSGFYGGFIA